MISSTPGTYRTSCSMVCSDLPPFGNTARIPCPAQAYSIPSIVDMGSQTAEPIAVCGYACRVSFRQHAGRRERDLDQRACIGPAVDSKARAVGLRERLAQRQGKAGAA